MQANSFPEAGRKAKIPAMLDLKYIKENAEAVKNNVADRFMSVDVDEVLRLYDRRNSLISSTDELRRRRNENAASMERENPQMREKLIFEGRNLKESIAAAEAELTETKNALLETTKRIPNMTHPAAPRGREEKDNSVISRYGELPEFNFKPKDHLELAAGLNLVDFETAAKVSGSKFYYLKNQAVMLDLALSRYALDILSKHNFTITITPDIAKEKIVEGAGFVPRGAEANIYALEDTDACLIGTAEITLGGFHADEIINLDKGPILLAGLSHCFRKEAGAAGKYSKGLYRVHQFTKVEMFACARAENSEQVLIELRDIEEEIFRGLRIPYRIVDSCTGDLGMPAYRKFDLEAWMPGRGGNGAWGEVTSASNCTDYQARRLGIRYRENGRTRYVHTLNGTAIAIPRTLVSLLENGQREDGSVTIPECLTPYCGFTEIKAL